LPFLLKQKNQPIYLVRHAEKLQKRSKKNNPLLTEENQNHYLQEIKNKPLSAIYEYKLQAH
jgi:shikimate kinase